MKVRPAARVPLAHGRALRVAPVVASLALATTATASFALPGPRLHTPREVLERSVECSAGIEGSQRTPVLLVHGTWTTPANSWSWSYRRVLPASGHPTCTVALPNHATGDIQRSTEYVVHAIRQIAQRASRRIAVIAHSQGALLGTMALRYWPDLAWHLDDFVGIAGVYASGSSYMDFDCRVPCYPAVQQMRPGSRLLAGYRRRPLPDAPSYTSIMTLTDEIVTPQPRASTLDGARNVVIQDFCGIPRPVEHITILGDAVTHALAMDALGHPGPVDPRRVSRAACLQTAFVGADIARGLAEAPPFVAKLALPSPADTDHEPPLRCHLDPACPKPRLRARLYSLTSPTHDRARPWTFTTTGRLELPEEAIEPCHGTVTVRIKRGTRAVSTRRTRLRHDCHFASSVTFGRSRNAGRPVRGPLRVLVTFGGNRELHPARATERTVRTH